MEEESRIVPSELTEDWQWFYSRARFVEIVSMFTSKGLRMRQSSRGGEVHPFFASTAPAPIRSSITLLGLMNYWSRRTSFTTSAGQLTTGITPSYLFHPRYLARGRRISHGDTTNFRSILNALPTRFPPLCRPSNRLRPSFSTFLQFNIPYCDSLTTRNIA